MRRSTRIAAIAGALAVVAVLAGIGWLRLAPRRTPAGQPALAKLDAASLQAFRDAFNAHSGETRLLAMLSPT